MPDPTIFTLDNPLDARQLTVYTEDSTKVGVHNLRIKARFSNYPTNIGASKDFTIEIDDICEALPFNISPTAAPADITYTLG